MIGTVFCNTTRPFLLLQGRWCLDVERSWLGLFKEIAAIMREGYLCNEESRKTTWPEHEGTNLKYNNRETDF